MRRSMTQVGNDHYVVYTCAGCPWTVWIKQDGNEEQYDVAFRPEWEGSVLFTVFPLETTGDETALLHIRLPAHATAAISTHCHIPAVVHIEPTHHRIVVEWRCALSTLCEPPRVLVAPAAEVAFWFLHPEEDPSEGHAAAGREVPLSREFNAGVRMGANHGAGHPHR